MERCPENALLGRQLSTGASAAGCLCRAFVGPGILAGEDKAGH